jgi:hypothetical protein
VAGNGRWQWSQETAAPVVMVTSSSQLTSLQDGQRQHTAIIHVDNNTPKTDAI